jgi:phosphoglycolate phosphatase
VIKAILFDLDGTLIDSAEGITKSARYALAHFGIEEPDEKRLYQFIGPPIVDSLRQRYGFSEEQANEGVAVYRERYNSIGLFECSLYPGVEACIKTLREQGYRVGMASSKPEETCRQILDHFGILSLFDDVVGATFDGRINSKEQVLLEVFRRWDDLSRDEMCLIGDTIYDVRGANAVGIPCVAVSFGFGDMQEMTAAGIVGSCDSLEELPPLLQKLGENENA